MTKSLCTQITILVIILTGGYSNMYAQLEYDSVLEKLQIPLLEIWTTDGTEPTGIHIMAPEDLWGIGLTKNEYVRGRMRISINDKTLYDSGEFIQDISGMQIKLRGNTSSYYWEKKPYKIKLTKKEDLLFRSENKYKDKDWILLRVYDGFLKRFLVGNKLGELLGLGWQPQWEYVNLIINGDYKGDYILIESIEKESGRLNINDTGYIIEDDAYWWNEDVYFKGNMLTHKTGYTFKYPESEDLNDSIINQIKNYIIEFEDLLNNNGDISSHINIVSFAAWLLAQDILGQGDSGGTNRYLYKEEYNPLNPYETPLKMGILWDFDAAFKSNNTWSDIHNRSYSFYFTKLLERQDFYLSYVSLWKNVRNTLFDDLTTYLHNIESSKGKEINESKLLNQKRWDDFTTPFSTELNDALQWLEDRFKWIDKQLLKQYSLKFIIDGEIYYTDSLIYREKIKYPKLPNKEGCIFSGWDKYPEIMPANDLIINGTFIANNIEYISIPKEKNVIIYDMTGRKIEKNDILEKGKIYIINNKKVISR